MVSLDIEDKIRNLFGLRLIPELIRWGSGQRMDNRLLKELIALQHDIYLLDKTLEESWSVDHKRMHYYWGLISNTLSNLGYSDQQVRSLLYRLRVYVDSELLIRKKVFPSFQQIRPFYYFKSCDVKLVRDLIYNRYPSLELSLPKVAWVIFDLITEVNDDISDEQEDRRVYNGNRFLFSLYTHGVEETLAEYAQFMDVLGQGMKRYATRIPDLIQEKARQEYDKVLDLIHSYAFNPQPEFIMHPQLNT